jgi:hypothetical protein
MFGVPLNRRVRLPNQMPHLSHNAKAELSGMELPLRSRGPGAAVSNSTWRGAPTIKLGVAGRRSTRETFCVNRQRSREHKVPRSRASPAGPLRGGALAVASADLLNRGVRLCRCGGGKIPTAPDLLRPSPFRAEEQICAGAWGLRWLRERWACGNLTTGWSGP